YPLPFVLAPASEVNLLHLEYFWFSGRMIVFDLAYDVQIRVIFLSRIFLAIGKKGVLLEDIRDTDLFLYRSCKEILNMDAEIVDQDVLGLTFVCEVESLGSRREMELCPNGKYIVVDSKNREYYKYLEPNLLDIHLDDKQEEDMLMSTLNCSPVTDQHGNNRDNGS
ncbi:hypothetical protein H5410_014787, partial [Solanum commersonii]